MRSHIRSVALLILCACVAAGAEKRVVFPVGVKPVGPYSPGIFAGDYLYVSGQGARTPDNQFPPTFEAQVRQCLENVKSIVVTAGLTLDHIVYSQVYLDDMANYELMNRVWQEYFPKAPPARAVLGVARMPISTPVEVNAVAVRDLSMKTVLASGAVQTPDRLYIPGVFGRDPKGDPAADAGSALDAMRDLLKSAGLDLGNVVFVNPYLTDAMPMNAMNQAYAKRFEFGNTPARATIRVAGLPSGARIEFTGVAVRDLGQRRAVRPKNMAPSATASPCVFAGDTLYCSAKAGFIPGPNSGIFGDDVGRQVRQTMRNLLDGLEEAGMDFSHVVASNVYVDNIDEFTAMNQVYGLYFKTAPPTRTTVQPCASVDRKPDAEGRSPKLEEISVIALR
jgi:reactive intermediate/imine deaminase